MRLLLFGVLLYCSQIFADEKYNYEIKKFEVPLDHFNYVNNKTFLLRFLYNDSFVDKSSAQKSPLFFYTGNEGDIETFAQNSGFLWETAKVEKACVVFAEHRYYGQSLPFGNTSYNVENIGYLSVEQTLEDFASLINALSSDFAPTIAFGGSYGGMLAAWLRMKYPHIVYGALAASAPIWQFNGLTPCDIFSKIVTAVFTESYSPNCSENIKNSWNMIRSYSANESGLKLLNDAFKFCSPLKNKEDVDLFFDYLNDLYGNLAMANYPYDNDFLAPLPGYPVRQFCYYLKEVYKDNNLLNAMQKAISVYSNFTGATKCLDYKSAYDPTIGGTAWDIQICNEIVMPMCSSSKDTMFPDQEWNFQSYSDKCFNKYKIRPKLNEMVFRYGGKNLESTSNIIFSNGLLDPWCGGGVLQSANYKNIIIIIPEGAHHIDLRKSNDKDPISVIEARKQEAGIIHQWIKYSYLH